MLLCKTISTVVVWLDQYSSSSDCNTSSLSRVRCHRSSQPGAFPLCLAAHCSRKMGEAGEDDVRGPCWKHQVLFRLQLTWIIIR